ncbi:MAG: aldo/keto reductase, partial [Lacrimispora sphenoides]
MQYRDFGKTGIKVSALGFGAMRLPILQEEQVDEERAVSMIRHAIDEGVNYIDTAYPYHLGESERIVGNALRD